jgi:UDP-N-acetylmuramate dehydrogenase
MVRLAEFDAIVKRDEPLAPYTYLKLGGPAEILVRPRTVVELSAVVAACTRDEVPLRVLGGGCNLIVRDEGVTGAVLRLTEPAFASVEIEGRRVRAGAGAPVSSLISASARQGLAGLETLIGIPGTVGGALRTNAGDRVGDIGQFVRRVTVLDARGVAVVRERDELQFADRASNLDDPVLLSAEFELETDDSDAIVRRLKRAWILRRGSQPASSHEAGRIFKNPRGLSAAALIEQAGLARTRVGGAEVGDRDANYFLLHPGAAARDVLGLMDLVRERVKEQFNVDLEREVAVW